MILYLVLWLFLVSLCVLNPKNRHVSFFFLFFLCLLVFFRGKTVGTDVYGYSLNFDKMTDNPITWNYRIPFEIGFNYVVLFFKNYISSNPLNCWGLMGLFYTLSFYNFAKKYISNYINIALLLFVLFGTYFLSYNIIRQSFACALIFCLFTWVDIRKLTNRQILYVSLGIIAVGYLFHPTVYIFILLVVCSSTRICRIFTKKFLIVAVVLSLLLCISQVIMPFIMGLVDKFLLEGKLINYALSNIKYGSDSGFSMQKLVLLSIFQVYTISVSKDVKNVFLLSSTLGVLFLNMFGVLVVEFARVSELLMGIGLIYWAQVWGEMRTRSSFCWVYRMSLVIYVSLLYFNIIIKNYGEIVPYVLR